MKRSIKDVDMKFLVQEMNYCQSQGIVTKEQRERILEQYEVKSKLNFIKVLLSIGAVLMGLGVLSFIASNWSAIGKLAKLLIIIGGFVGVNTIAYYFEDKLPKTSRSLNYLSVFIYGSGIFLIGQMFNFGGHFTQAFLLWSIGTLTMAVLLRDKIMFVFAIGLSAIYLNGYRDLSILGSFPVFILMILPILYYSTSKVFKRDNVITFFNNLLALNLILHLVDYWDTPGVIIAFIYLAIGLGMYFYPFSFARTVFKLQGSLIFGTAGVFLTIPYFWERILVTHATPIAMIFAVVFSLFLLMLTRKEDLIALAFICIVIFRYYVDTMYSFMPKSLFFIVSGLILLGFGYYFERMRKRIITEKGGLTHD